MKKNTEHKFEDGQKVIIKETGEVVTIDHWWFMSNKITMPAQYNVVEKPSTWFSESELEIFDTNAPKESESVKVMDWEKFKEESKKLIDSDGYVAVEREEFDWIVKKFEEQQTKVDRCEKALKFYANKENHELWDEAEKANLTEFVNTIDCDGGDIAKSALKELDSYICPNSLCKSEETFSVNDFLDRGIEYRECETCGCKYRVHFSTTATKIEIEGE